MMGSYGGEKLANRVAASQECLPVFFVVFFLVFSGDVADNLLRVGVLVFRRQDGQWAVRIYKRGRE